MQPNQAGAAGGALLGMLCGLAFVLVIGSLVGGVILRASVSTYNSLVGQKRGSSSKRKKTGSRRNSTSDVPEPEFSHAMGIVLVTTIANWIAGFLIGMVMGLGGAAIDADPRSVRIYASLFSLPVGFLVLSGMLTMMLPSTFVRSMLVSLIFYAISIVIVLVIVGVVILTL